MIAAVLHLNIGAMTPEPVNQMARRFAHRHDVIDLNLLGLADQIGRAQPRPCFSLHLFGIADDPRHFGHGGEGFGFGLRRATGHNHRNARILAGEFADFLLGLAHSLGGHGAGIHHHRAL